MGGGAYYLFFYTSLEEVIGKKQAKGEDGEGNHLETFNVWYQSLDFEEQMCFVFDSTPSKLAAVFWSHSYSDIQTKIKLVIGFNSVKFAQMYESLIKVSVAVLGGGSDTKKPNKKDIPTNATQAKAMFDALM